MRLVVTCNGPGETAGWLRPLLQALYAREPQLEAHVFYVPDDYATGNEAGYARSLFANARVYDPKAYLRVALGAAVPELPSADAVLYLGGDLMHAARLHRRFGGAFAVYKFGRPRYARSIARAYALDASNASALRAAGIGEARIETVGNLAIDGAALEARAAAPANAPAVLFMPGSRPNEVRQLLPFFFTTALRMRREHPDLPVAFGISPFTPPQALREAIEGGGDPRLFSQKGRIEEDDGHVFLCGPFPGDRFPVLHHALAAAAQARLVVTIPGTKVIEVATLGTPILSCTPFNAPELAVINGPLTFLDRIPVFGVPAKRAAVLAYARRHVFHTQPNIDAGDELVRELHGTLTPGRVARVALDLLADEAWCDEHGRALAALYAQQAGAAGRMADSLRTLAR